MTIIRREKIKKPRILFLDFDKKVVEAISQKGYVTIGGDSGLSGKPMNIPQHHSEVELIFWDCSRFIPSYLDDKVVEKIKPYFDYVRNKDGIVTVLLSKNQINPRLISRATGHIFGLNVRTTSNIIPPIFEKDETDYLRPLLERYVLDENLVFSINWVDNGVSYTEYYSDEDDNKYVGYNEPDLLIFPFVNNQIDFILCALQDCFPYLTDEDIFPDIHNVVWLNSDDFVYPEIKKLDKTVLDIQQKAIKEIVSVKKKIENIRQKISFLNQALISDDSDSFKDEDKLKTQVVMMFKTIGFSVKDLDDENKKMGFALKEDIQLKDKDYFALVEVKGTENGAKASWIRTDLNSHVTEFSRLNNSDIGKLNSMLVFNHDRRIKPTDRSRPFSDDPKLVSYCEASNISLIPIFELYKLCVAVLIGKMSKEEARLKLKAPGLFLYNEKQ